MKKYTIKIGMQILGWTFIVFGVIGIFLPFLQGFILLAIGAFILSRHSMWFAKRLVVLRLKYPAFDRVMDKIEKRLGSWVALDATATKEYPGPNGGEGK